MPAETTSAVRRFLRTVGPPPADAPDPELLRRFEAERDGAAFAALVRRHGRMVLEVCRCVLGNHADAEDAFQATFLVLARRAGAVRKSNSLASWLHGVACRTARKALTAATRRRTHEGRVPPPEPDEPNDRNWSDVQQVLHEELVALPERLRAVLVLCYLQGETQDRAAESLGLTRAAVKKRLERGRERLRERLERRGLGPVAVLAAFASPAAVSAAPAALVESAVAVAVAFVEGHGVAGVSSQVLALADGGSPMILGKFATGLWLIPALAAGIVLAGTSGTPNVTRAEEPGKPAAVRPADDKAKEKEETPAEREAKWLSGEWRIAFVEAEGKTAFPEGLPDTARITFKDGKAEVTGGFKFLFVRNFAFKLDPTTNPKEIDVTFTEGPMADKMFEGIYVTLENEVRICLRLEHTKLGRPKGFSTVSGTLYTFFLRPVDEKGPPPKFKSAPAPAKPGDLPAEVVVPRPAKTPFDNDAKKKEGYLVGYNSGYTWAKGVHLWCPTNPGKENLHVIRGWVEGWQAGVKDGGTADLPAKFAPYLVWDEAGGNK
jgi:RNA polymerase sigma factor (sigma-70 family)